MPHNRDADEHQPHVGADGDAEVVGAVGQALTAFIVEMTNADGSHAEVDEDAS